jgi:hypothetical protein
MDDEPLSRRRRSAGGKRASRVTSEIDRFDVDYQMARSGGYESEREGGYESEREGGYESERDGGFDIESDGALSGGGGTGRQRTFRAWLEPEAGGGWVNVGDVTSTAPRLAALKIIRQFVLGKTRGMRGKQAYRMFATRVAVSEDLRSSGHAKQAVSAYRFSTSPKLKVNRVMSGRMFPRDVPHFLAGRIATKARKPRAPKRAKAASPKRAKTRSPSPKKKASPKRAKTRSPSPKKKASPKRAKSRSPSPKKKASPKRAKSRSPSPKKKASPKRAKSRSPSPKKKASPKRAKSRSPSPKKKASPKKASTKKKAAPKRAKAPIATAPARRSMPARAATIGRRGNTRSRVTYGK